MKVLIANRGEIAVRIARAVRDLGWRSVAVHSDDDTHCGHLRYADEVVALPGTGPAAYLNTQALLDAASQTGCGAVHPGYGFVSEDAFFAKSCIDVGLSFIGPDPDTLALAGDKIAAREFAAANHIPVLAGTGPDTTRNDVRTLLEDLGTGASVILKAAAGGGGRGMRRVHDAGELDEAWERASSEALGAFGDGTLYAEVYLAAARHVEIQLLGDGQGGVCHLGERECTLQRRHQKLVEFAPSPSLDPELREDLCAVALEFGRALELRSLATVEFLVTGREEPFVDNGSPGEGDASEFQAGGPDEVEPADFAFIEVNPRLQVEHTVTEEVTGIDLVCAQLRIAEGATLADLGMTEDRGAEPKGMAVQVRVNLETRTSDGEIVPSSGRLTRFEIPSGPGIRVDTHGYAGYQPNPRFDPLIAKVIASVATPNYSALLARAARALEEVHCGDASSNAGFLSALLAHGDVRENRLDTQFVEAHASELWAAAETLPKTRNSFAPKDGNEHAQPSSGAETAKQSTHVDLPADGTIVTAPMQATIVEVPVSVGEPVGVGTALAVLEAMKMEHVITAGVAGTVTRVICAKGDIVTEGQPLLALQESEDAVAEVARSESFDPDTIRPDLAELLARRRAAEDEARPEAVAKRRKTGQRTARENLADLCDENSFVEYGGLAIAAQRKRRTLEDLTANTPADGMLAGIATINAELFGPDQSACAVLSYDYTVLAGTQGLQNHRKKDRLFEIALRRELPVVFFTEGGGGRPGDTDGLPVTGLECWAFQYFGRLSGAVPLVGINSGRCFAGNAVLLGCCDVVIATENSNIGMGGPAMIEGGGLGRVTPDQIGTFDEQRANGVIDIPVANEAEAVIAARKYLAYFQGPLPSFDCADQRQLRNVVPENRLRIYDVRTAIDLIADTDSVLELRRDFGFGMVTALARIEGRPLGIIANNPTHLAGAIDVQGADKCARFMQLCDAFDLPILFLCDTPGFMVGPEVEREALVRHAARLFVTGASLDVPFFTIVLRKGYGLGAQAMTGGSFKAPHFTVAWPTGEFGGMGLEGAVQLGFRKELEAAADPDERRELYEKLVARMYEIGKGLSIANNFEIDDVIDPAESRRWILSAMKRAPVRERGKKKRPFVDTW